VNDYINDPGEAYERFSRSAHFKTHVEVSLFVLFILGIRIMMTGSFWGYILLGAFVIGSWRWLTKYTDYSTNQTRVFMQENINSLPEVKEKEEEDRESSGEKTAKNGR
jgi:cytochrome b subunit of formate dehydrogenase